MTALRLSVAATFASAVCVASGALPSSCLAVVWGCGFAASCFRRDALDRGEL